MFGLVKKSDYDALNKKYTKLSEAYQELLKTNGEVLETSTKTLELNSELLAELRTLRAREAIRSEKARAAARARWHSKDE